MLNAKTVTQNILTISLYTPTNHYYPEKYLQVVMYKAIYNKHYII